MRYWGYHKLSRQYVYRARVQDCRGCAQKEQCTKDRARSVSFHIHKDAIDKAKALSQTPAYRISQRMRKRIEELFGEAKETMGFRRAKFRRTKWVQEQVLMTATAQNIKRMVKYLSRPKQKAGAVAVRAVGVRTAKRTLKRILDHLFQTRPFNHSRCMLGW